FRLAVSDAFAADRAAVSAFRLAVSDASAADRAADSAPRLDVSVDSAASARAISLFRLAVSDVSAADRAAASAFSSLWVAGSKSNSVVETHPVQLRPVAVPPPPADTKAAWA